MDILAIARNITNATSSTSLSHSQDNSRTHSRTESAPRRENLLQTGFRKSKRRPSEQSVTKMDIPAVITSGDNSDDPGVLGGDTSQQLPKSLKSAPENASQQPGFGHSVSNTFGQKLSSRFSLKSLLRFPSHDRFGTHQEDTSDQQQLREIRNPLAMLPGSNHSHENGGQAEESPQPSILPKRQPSKRGEQLQLVSKQFRREKFSSEEKLSPNPVHGFSSLSKQESKITNDALSNSALVHFRSSDTTNVTCTASNLNKSAAFSYYEDGSNFKIQNNPQLLLKPVLGGLQRGIALDRIPELHEGDSEEIDSFHPQVWKKNSRAMIQENQCSAYKQSANAPNLALPPKANSSASQKVKPEDAPPSIGPAVRHIRSSNNVNEANPMSPNPSLEMRVKSGKSSHSLILHMSPNPRPEWRGHRDTILQVLRNAAFLLDAFDRQYSLIYPIENDKEEDDSDEEFQTARLWDDSSSLGPDSIHFSKLVLELTWKDFERRAILIAGSLDAYREMKAHFPADHAQRAPELELLILAECNLVQVKSLFGQIDGPPKIKPDMITNSRRQRAANKKDVGKLAMWKQAAVLREPVKSVGADIAAKRTSNEALDMAAAGGSDLSPDGQAVAVPHQTKLQRTSSDASGDSDNIPNSNQADSMTWFKKEPTKKTTTPLSMSEKYKGYAKMIDLIE